MLLPNCCQYATIFGAIDNQGVAYWDVVSCCPLSMPLELFCSKMIPEFRVCNFGTNPWLWERRKDGAIIGGFQRAMHSLFWRKLFYANIRKNNVN